MIVSVAKPTRKYHSMLVKRYFFIYSCLALPMVILILFWIYPLIDLFRFSLTNLNAFNYGHPKWVGLENYSRALHNVTFWVSMKNTGLYMTIRLVIEMPLALLVAFLCTKIKRGRAIYLSVCFLPVVVSLTAISLLFEYIFNPSYGLVNHVLGWFHIGPLNFLTSPSQALPSIESIDIWHSLGYAVVLLLAALDNVPRELVEAAHVDGANGWKVFWRIMFPLILPIFGVVLVNSITSVLQLFSPIYVLTSSSGGSPGGPLNSTLNLMTYTYDSSFSQYLLGFGSALSVIIFVINLALMLIVFKLTKANKVVQ